MTAQALPTRRASPLLPFLALAIAAAVISMQALGSQLPLALWRDAIFAPDTADIRQMLVHYSWLPRLVTAWLCGAALGLAGLVFQQVLRNPLASPVTLGVSAGAKLALALATLWAPALLAFGPEWPAFAGGALAIAAVLGLAWRRGLSPTAVVLAGLVVSLYCSAVSAVLMLLNHEYLVGLFIWGAGSLAQQDWSVATRLLPQLAVLGLPILLMARPLALLDLEETSARSLGLSLRGTRLAALALAVGLAAAVVAGVGIIGFIGLAAPAIARLAGARRFRDRLVWAPLLGAALLWLADAVAQLLSSNAEEAIPTGALTALLGAPMLLWLVPRLRAGLSPLLQRPAAPPRRVRRPWLLIGGIAILLLAGLWIALAVGPGPQGWAWGWGEQLDRVLPWRAPRAVAALGAGAMLALAGTVLQRMTGNPMASPEVLGLNAGAALGVLGTIFLFPGAGRAVQIAAGAAATLLILAAILAPGRRSGFAPERVILAGIALSAFFDAIVVAMMATGDPRALAVLNWIAGSTYPITPHDAAVVGIAAIVMLGLSPLFARWLEILPLGTTAARSVGVSPAVSRFGLLLLTAVLTAAATLAVGPLSFVGLMAPHIARMLGLQRALPQMIGAALAGAAVMLAADWLGRVAIFPRQIPAGLVATLIGGPCLMLLMRRAAPAGPAA